MAAPVFAEIILPLSIERKLTYRVPEEWVPDLKVGKRVIVPVGRNKLYSGLVFAIHDRVPEIGQVKEIHTILDDQPIVHERLFTFWEWICRYYMCFPGDVMNAAIPSSLRLQSETTIVLKDPKLDDRPDWLDQDEEFIIDLLLDRESVTVQDIQRVFPGKSAQKKLKRLLEQDIVVVSEEIGERFKPLTEVRIRLSSCYQDEKELELLFSQLEQDNRKRKQLDALLFFMKVLFDDKSKDYVRKRDLTKQDDLSASSIQTLIRNGVLEEYEAVIDRIAYSGEPTVPVFPLSDSQQEALLAIKEEWQTKDTVLLHGVTSSGKTEIYLHLIEEALARGEQVLYLLPEIALTTQIIQRLRKHLGDRVGVYHSRYSGNERVEIWNQVLNFGSTIENNSRAQVILGARSALFLPYSNLGLVIVDEEHDSSYKQQDPAPRYHARDSAGMLARTFGAKVLLGSATPSLESYANARNGRYGLVTLKERFGGIKLPEIIVTDIREAARKKMMKSHFSPVMMDAVSAAFANKEQVILFQNRRGFSSFLECRQCSWIPHCKNCSVTLTYHKFSRQLKCHYCGYAQETPSSCQQCGDAQLLVRGFGTEKIEEEIGVYFPEHQIARLDLDTAGSKSSYQRILSDFEEQRIDLLVGTQMVSKGLDFEHVSTVGILDADQLLNFPDFRAHERSFQLMAQVSGRSGRKNKRGKVIIQTRQPDHWVIRDVVNNNYESFFFREMEDRRNFGYPPHSRLIDLRIRHKEEVLVHEAAGRLAVLLRNRLGSRIHGPHIPLVPRVRNQYYRTILVNMPKDESSSAIKLQLKETILQFQADRKFSPVQIIPDVDPM